VGTERRNLRVEREKQWQLINKEETEKRRKKKGGEK
jgi:hypothetical protein